MSHVHVIEADVSQKCRVALCCFLFRRTKPMCCTTNSLTSFAHALLQVLSLWNV